MNWKWALLLPHILFHCYAFGPETVVQVNSKKWIYFVPERFLSMTVDPLTLAAASPLTQQSLSMAKGLSPSFVRIGGLGTNALRFGKEFMVNNSTLTESIWDSVNDFARRSGLDLVASLNPTSRFEGVWDSQNSLELISYSQRQGHIVAWQLGYDLQDYNATGAEIGRDLVRLRKILDGFPQYANSPVFGPDLSSVTGAKQIRFVRDLLLNAGTALGSVILQPKFSKGDEKEDAEDLIASMTNELDTYVWNKEIRLGKALPKKPIWIAEPTASQGSLQDAIKLAKRLGVAAKLGVQLYLKQAGVNALKTPTPEFWFSLLYKNLVGQGVLDNKIVSRNESSLQVFSHCTAIVPTEVSILDTDWNYEKGAVTIFGVNESPEPSKLTLKVTNKEEPLHIYTLTSTTASDLKWETLLNGQKLTLSPTWDLPVISPKVKKASKSASVLIPGESIFFVVMPDSKVRTCSVPPLSAPDLSFVDLTKRLRLNSKKKVEVSEEAMEPEDAFEEGSYVTFTKTKRHQPEINENNRVELLGRNLVRTLISKLAPKKPEVAVESLTDDEIPVKYITFNANSFLNKLAEGVKEELKEEDELESIGRPNKYAALTAAVKKQNAEEVPLDPLESTSGDNLARTRRSSNEDRPSEVATNSEIKLLQQISEFKKTGTPRSGAIGDVVDSLEHVEVKFDRPDNAEDIDDVVRSTRHIDEDKVESTDGEPRQERESSCFVESSEEDTVAEVNAKTSDLLEIVKETEKIDNVSESPEGVLVPSSITETKLNEMMLEAARTNSDPEPFSGVNERATSDSNSDNVRIRQPYDAGNDQRITIALPRVTDELSVERSPFPEQPNTQPEPTRNSIRSPEQQGADITTNQESQIVQKTDNSHTQKIPMDTQSNPEILIPIVPLAEPYYNKQKEMMIDSILTKMVEAENVQSETLPAEEVESRVVNENKEPLVAVDVGNNAVLLTERDLKVLNKDQEPKPVTLDGGPRFELANEDDAVPSVKVSREISSKPAMLESDQHIELTHEIDSMPSVKVSREIPSKPAMLDSDPLIELTHEIDVAPSVKVSREIPSEAAVLNSSPPIELVSQDEGVSSIKVVRQIPTKVSPITLKPKTATLPAPLEAVAAATTPAGPVSPFKESAKPPPPALKAPTPEELRERFKILKDKMVELRSQYVIARDKRLEEIKKQVAVARTAPVGSESEETIKSTIRRREAELKDWFKKFDKREIGDSENVELGAESNNDNDKKMSVGRLPLFTNDEGLDMANLHEDESRQSSNHKRSAELMSDTQYQRIDEQPDPAKTASDVRRKLFPLDTKTHGIVYNNKIYPAKLFGLVEPSEGNDELISSQTRSVSSGEIAKHLSTSTDVNIISRNQEQRSAIASPEVVSEFIPVVLLSPETMRDKRSTFSGLENQFNQFKDDLLPKINSWLKYFGDIPPWKRDLERSSRTRRSVEEFLRTNDLRSFLPNRKSRKLKTETESTTLPATTEITVEPDENNQIASKSIQTDGYCEEIGTSSASVIRDPFEVASAKKDLRNIPSPVPTIEPDTQLPETEAIASVISGEIKRFFSNFLSLLKGSADDETKPTKLQCENEGVSPELA